MVEKSSFCPVYAGDYPLSPFRAGNIIGGQLYRAEMFPKGSIKEVVPSYLHGMKDEEMAEWGLHKSLIEREDFLRGAMESVARGVSMMKLENIRHEAQGS